MPGEDRTGALVVLGALDVVFGDIGTSPLYAMRTVLGEPSRLDSDVVYGPTSTVVWSMVAIVSVLYVGLLMRADNEGEGGLLAWRIEDTPAGPEEAAVQVDRLGERYDGVTAVEATFGYRERPDVVDVLARARDLDPERLGDVDPDTAVLFVSVPIPLHDRNGDMPRWRQRLFLLLDRLASDPVAQRRLPRERTVVIGRELTL